MALLNYKSEVPAERLAAARQIEQNRRDLVAGRATHGALEYARFLIACENDATITTFGAGAGFQASDGDVIRAYPFLREVVRDEGIVDWPRALEEGAAQVAQ